MDQQIKKLTTEEYNLYKNDNAFIHNIVYAVTCCNSNGKFLYKKAMTNYTTAKKEFIVNDKQIKTAQKEYNKRKKDILKSIKNKLVFVGMGMDFKPKDNTFIDNHRIRTYFLNNDNVLCFVEFGSCNDKNFLRVDHSLFNTKKDFKTLKEREQEKRLNLEKLKCNEVEYKKQNILNLVNKWFNCSFKEVEVYSYFINTEDYTCKSKK